MKALINNGHPTLGTCYYPEHWDRSMWRKDLERMLEAGIETIRIAEFAWSKVEPTEGNFTFDFFDGFLDIAEELKMKVIMGTPTATPPAWLTNKYPEVLNASLDGRLYRHGMRRHYNYNSPVYQRLSSIIVQRFAEHYAPRKCVIGWQIDNEINCEVDVFYSESDTAAFREYLKAKYGTLNALNEAWGTVFWNQTYTAWDEIYVPGHAVHDEANPHLKLDYLRFVSDSANRWTKMQEEIIRPYLKKNDFITTNGIFGHLDYQKMARETIDFITYDSYPNFAYCLGMYDSSPENFRDRKWSRNLSEVRAISPVFGIMEQQSGANGWNCTMEAPTPRPGQITLWTMQSIAHGADFVSYFRWRTAAFGTEMYWHGILDYSGRDNRRLKEIKDIHKITESLKGLAGSMYEAKVGILRDYDNIYDAEYDLWHGRVEKISQKSLFETMQLTHTPFDYVYIEGADIRRLSEYEVLFYPHPSIMDEKTLKILKEYVENGGKLIFGCRSAYKDKTGKCVQDNLPGLIAPLTGCDIPEYSLIAPDAGSVTVKWGNDTFEATEFTDLLQEASDGRVVAEYTTDYYAGSGAVTVKKTGKGEAYYYGSAFTQGAVRAFLDNTGVMSPYDDIIEAPDCVELALRRAADGRGYLFVLNYSKDETKIRLKKAAEDVINKRMTEGSVNIQGYGTFVFIV